MSRAALLLAFLAPLLLSCGSDVTPGDAQCSGRSDGAACNICDLAGACMDEKCVQAQAGAPHCVPGCLTGVPWRPHGRLTPSGACCGGCITADGECYSGAFPGACGNSGEPCAVCAGACSTDGVCM